MAERGIVLQQCQAASPSPFAEILDVGRLIHSEDLLDRSEGSTVFEATKAKLANLPTDSLVMVDLTTVTRVGYSALKELLAVIGLNRSSETDESYVVFRVDMNNREIVEQIQLVAKDRGYTVPVITSEENFSVIGKLTKAERDTMKVIEEAGEVTSAQLKERLGILGPAASNRLRTLHGRGVIRRHERTIPGRGGREFVYRPLIPRRHQEQARQRSAAESC